MRQRTSNSVDKHVGARVRMRRKLMSMSQGKLADALGLSFQQIQKYENGSTRIGASRLQEIAGALQVEISFFFEGVPGAEPQNGKTGDDTPSPADVTEFVSSPGGLKLMRAFMRLKDAKLRRRVADLVDDVSRLLDES